MRDAACPFSTSEGGGGGLARHACLQLADALVLLPDRRHRRLRGTRTTPSHWPEQVPCKTTQVSPPPPFTRTKRTRRVPHPVLIGHAASLSQVPRFCGVQTLAQSINESINRPRTSGLSAPPPPLSRTKWTRRVPHPVLIGHVSSSQKVAAGRPQAAPPSPRAAPRLRGGARAAYRAPSAPAPAAPLVSRTSSLLVECLPPPPSRPTYACPYRTNSQEVLLPPSSLSV